MTFDPKEVRALVKRLLAFAWDYPCVHCGSPVLETNSRGQIICIGCLNENPSDPQSQTICEAADTLTAALDENERLWGEISERGVYSGPMIDALLSECKTLRTEKHADAEAIGALREAVKDAFYEGWASYSSPCCPMTTDDEEWAESMARAALKEGV